MIDSTTTTTGTVPVETTTTPVETITVAVDTTTSTTIPTVDPTVADPIFYDLSLLTEIDLPVIPIGSNNGDQVMWF